MDQSECTCWRIPAADGGTLPLAGLTLANLLELVTSGGRRIVGSHTDLCYGTDSNGREGLWWGLSTDDRGPDGVWVDEVVSAHPLPAAVETVQQLADILLSRLVGSERESVEVIELALSAHESMYVELYVQRSRIDCIPAAGTYLE